MLGTRLIGFEDSGDVFDVVALEIVAFGVEPVEAGAKLLKSGLFIMGNAELPVFNWWTGSAACSRNERKIGPNGVFNISPGKSIMCDGIGLPTRASDKSLLKLLQLCLSKLYEPILSDY